MQPYLITFLAALCSFALLWPVSLWRRDASVVDFWWGPGFLLLAGLAVALAEPEPTARSWLLLGLIGVWAVRMGAVLSARRFREGREDPRYTTLRRAWEPGFWWKSLGVVFLLQGTVQWAIAAGAVAGILAPASPLGLLAWAGAALAVAGIGIEAQADAELDAFKRAAPPDALCETGMRAHLRHPNYLGEIVFWAGIALICIDGGAWAGLISPALILIFLTKISGAPMLDEHLAATKPGYAAYRARVPGFIPAFRRPDT